jgi:LacI family transcriptional regulator
MMSLVLAQDPEGQVQASIDYLLYQRGISILPPLLPLAMKIVIDENLPKLA